MDIMEFFQLSEGRWKAIRTTHHLAFQRAETGQSEIVVQVLSADAPQVIETCQLHGIDAGLALGGAYVSWKGEMEWDQEDENHQGSTSFALVKDMGHPWEGSLLRDRGYAEAIPAIGHYSMSVEDVLTLTTEYGVMSSTEQFWFADPNIRLRTSTVSLSGGFTTTTFSSEIRVTETYHEDCPSHY
ncbi:MAG: phycobiliprotein lyase [Acaryochloris sp. RU_4_1]|nr:phycobiliprotein lyase [Acaryochloris sp. SU_5_25]NJM66222.1 phycobiliprotein lyase [Acaryochloris sp. RU_4_1]NJR55311.1 phycobiliprotein lyase [Acaryochloris sp. CRU_2_0]